MARSATLSLERYVLFHREERAPFASDEAMTFFHQYLEGPPVQAQEEETG
jgi:hypothetical protein